MISIAHLEHTRDVAFANADRAYDEGKVTAEIEWERLGKLIQKRIDRRKSIPFILLGIASTVACCIAAWSGSAIAGFQ